MKPPDDKPSLRLVGPEQSHGGDLAEAIFELIAAHQECGELNLFEALAALAVNVQYVLTASGDPRSMVALFDELLARTVTSETAKDLARTLKADEP